MPDLKTLSKSYSDFLASKDAGLPHFASEDFLELITNVLIKLHDSNSANLLMSLCKALLLSQKRTEWLGVDTVAYHGLQLTSASVLYTKSLCELAPHSEVVEQWLSEELHGSQPLDLVNYLLFPANNVKYVYDAGASRVVLVDNDVLSQSVVGEEKDAALRVKRKRGDGHDDKFLTDTTEATSEQVIASGENESKLLCCEICDETFLHLNEVHEHMNSQHAAHLKVQSRSSVGNAMKRRKISNKDVWSKSPKRRTRASVAAQDSQSPVEEGNIKCDICGKRFHLTYNFKRHCYDSHNMTDQMVKDLVSRKKIQRKYSPDSTVKAEKIESLVTDEIHVDRNESNQDADAAFFIDKVQSGMDENEESSHWAVEAAKKGSLECNVCGKRFPTNYNLKRHLAEVHKYGSMSKLGYIECGYNCPYKSYSEDMMAAHMQSKLCLTCVICNETFRSRELHVQHKKRCHTRNHNQCEICGGKSYVSASGLWRHFTVTDCTACWDCNESFGSREDLEQHQSEHISKGLTTCTKCNRNFTTMWRFVKHMRTYHSSSQPNAGAGFDCSKCQMIFNDNQQLKAHMNKKHKGLKKIPGKFKCNKCSKRFHLLLNFERHLQQVHEFSGVDIETAVKEKIVTESCSMENSYRCEVCRKTFISTRFLKMHLRLSHQMNIREVVKEVHKYRFIECFYNCESCRETFHLGTTFIKHLMSKHRIRASEAAELVHSHHKQIVCVAHDKRESRVRCHVCYRTFLYHSNLKRHLENVHRIGENASKLHYFFCPFGCSYKTHSRASLKMHEDSKICLTCSPCNVQFTDRQMHLTHKKNVHRIDKAKCNMCLKSFRNLPYHFKSDCLSCWFCNESFKDKEAFDLHESEHQSKGLLTCKLCEVECSSMSAYALHMMRKHFEDSELISHTHMSEFKSDIKEPTAADAVSADVAFLNDESEEQEAANVTHFACDQCVYSTKHKHLFKLHMSRSHATNHIEDFSSYKYEKKQQKKFACKICRKKFMVASNLKRHLEEVHKTKVDRTKTMKFFQCAFKCTYKTHCRELMKAHEDSKICLKCPVCDLQFSNRQLHLNHKRNVHKKKNSLTCNMCLKSYTVPHGLHLHYESDCLCCWYCNESFKDKESFDLHESEHSATGASTCTLCKTEFKTMRHYGLHMMRNHFKPGPDNDQQCPSDAPSTSAAPGGPVGCPHCSLTFPDHAGQEAHRVEAHPNTARSKGVLCVECGRTLRNQATFLDHLNEHRGEEPYRCPVCPQTFPTKRKRWMHNRQEHSGGFLCQHCGENCTSKHTLHYHLVSKHPDVATTLPKFSCAECDRAFPTRQLLTAHTDRVHRGVRQFGCTVCGKKFSQKAHLEEHRGVHDRRPRFFCETCGDGFVHRFSYKRHVIKHMNVKFPCPVCERSFDTMMDLRRHVHHTKLHAGAAVRLPDFAYPGTSIDRAFRSQPGRKTRTPNAKVSVLPDMTAVTVQPPPVSTAVSTETDHVIITSDDVRLEQVLAAEDVVINVADQPPRVVEIETMHGADTMVEEMAPASTAVVVQRGIPAGAPTIEVPDALLGGLAGGGEFLLVDDPQTGTSSLVFVPSSAT